MIKKLVIGTTSVGILSSLLAFLGVVSHRAVAHKIKRK